ncbi:MAG: MarR family transcriptional regulator [Rhodobacteraceae bacterium]|nr:MarR family transcriptional regulator [Paracoccaceae bacterium]
MDGAPRDSFDLEEFLPYRLCVAASRVSREFADRYRREFGISIAQWRVLAHLSQAGAVSVREIHACVDMDKSKVSRAAAQLQSAGHITKRENARDRRLVELSLTPSGQDLLAQLIPIAQTYHQELRARLSGTDRELAQALIRLAD